jgi:LPS sulfotransferase NodH
MSSSSTVSRAQTEPLRQVTVRYLVCSTPRSGSSYFCEALAATGVAGSPQLEYMGITPFGEGAIEYLRGRVSAHAGPNGAWGAKVFWDHFARMTNALLSSDEGPAISSSSRRLSAMMSEAVKDHAVAFSRTAVGRRLWDLASKQAHRRDVTLRDPKRVAEALDAVFPNLKYVHLVRRDVLGQAISMVRARETGMWQRRQGEPTEKSSSSGVAYDRQEIARQIRRIELHNQNWAEFFQATNADLAKVCWEDVLTDTQGTTATVLTFLGIDAPPFFDIQPSLLRQSDDASQQWRERYLEGE